MLLMMTVNWLLFQEKTQNLITQNLHLNVYLVKFPQHCHYYEVQQPLTIKKRKHFMQSLSVYLKMGRKKPSFLRKNLMLEKVDK